MIWNQLPATSGSLAIKLAKHQEHGNWSWVKESDGSFGVAFEMKVDCAINFLSKTRYFHVKKKHFEGIGYLLTITCSDFGLLENFESFCADLISSTELSESTANAISIIENRISLWLRLFKIMRGMSRQKAIGLFGELIFLDKWLKAGHNVSSWLGSSDSPQDFVCNSTKIAVEVKTVGYESRIVGISSLYQLDYDGDLFLVVVRFNDPKDESSAITLSSFIERIRASLSEVDKNIFNKKIIEYGYHSDDDMAQLSISLEDINYYSVANTFPKVSRSMLPNEVADCSYELNFTQCVNYIIDGEVFLEKIKK